MAAIKALTAPPPPPNQEEISKGQEGYYQSLNQNHHMKTSVFTQAVRNPAKEVTSTRVQVITATNAGRYSEVKKKEEQWGVIQSTADGGSIRNVQMSILLGRHQRK